jgi:hypothetical protein
MPPKMRGRVYPSNAPQGAQQRVKIASTDPASQRLGSLVDALDRAIQIIPAAASNIATKYFISKIVLSKITGENLSRFIRGAQSVA